MEDLSISKNPMGEASKNGHVAGGGAPDSVEISKIPMTGGQQKAVEGPVCDNSVYGGGKSKKNGEY